MNVKQTAASAVIFAAACVTLVGCERPGPVRLKNSNQIMGTGAEITVDAPDRATARQALEAAYARLEDVDRLMSDYVAESEIGRLNALAAGQSMSVSPETFHCLQRAADIARMSGGAFDVTCRPLVRLWKQAGKENRVPSDAALLGTLARVGWQKIELDPETRSVTLGVAGLQVDLGGIAKGYALDLAADALRAAGATSGLVNVGGDVRALGPQAGGRPWRVGVQHPLKPRGEYIHVIALYGGAVATSGIQQRFTEIDGRRYSHIIDPRTGRPAEQSPQVTVMAPDGLSADAWATALSVLSVEEGQALIAAGKLPGIEVLWILSEGDRLVIHQTPGFAQHVIE